MYPPKRAERMGSPIRNPIPFMKTWLTGDASTQQRRALLNWRRKFYLGSARVSTESLRGQWRRRFGVGRLGNRRLHEKGNSEFDGFTRDSTSTLFQSGKIRYIAHYALPEYAVWTLIFAFARMISRHFAPAFDTMLAKQRRFSREFLSVFFWAPWPCPPRSFSSH